MASGRAGRCTRVGATGMQADRGKPGPGVSVRTRGRRATRSRRSGEGRTSRSPRWAGRRERAGGGGAGLALRTGSRQDRGRRPRALAHLRSIRSTNAPASIDGSSENGTCETRAGVVNRAPGVGGVGGGVVAVHMVYSKARKRADAMEAMGWWRASVRRPGGGRGGGEVGGGTGESPSSEGRLGSSRATSTAASAAMGLACSSRTRTFGRTRRAPGVCVRGGHPHRHVPVLRARSRRGWRGSVVGAERGERGRARRAVAGGPRGCVDGAEAGGPHRDRAGLRDAPERRVERVLGQVKGRDGRGRVERFVVSRRRCVRLYWDLRWLSKKSFDRSIDQYPSSSS